MIYPKKYSKQKQATRSRKLVPQPEMPSDGIELRKSKITGEWQEFCVTAEATKERRLQVWDAAQGRCQGKTCGGTWLKEDWHWHHVRHRSQGGDDSLANALALCPKCHSHEHGIKTVTP